MLTGFPAIQVGHSGRRIWDLSLLDAISPRFNTVRPYDLISIEAQLTKFATQKPLYLTEWLPNLILVFVKLTFLVFYLNLFRPLKWMRRLCYVGIIFTNIVIVGLTIAQVALETSNVGKLWAQRLPVPHFKELHAINLLLATASFAIDLFILILPIMGIAKVQMAAHHRWGILLIFLTGSAFVPQKSMHSALQSRADNSTLGLALLLSCPCTIE